MDMGAMTMASAVGFDEFGGPEVVGVRRVRIPTPGDGEVVVRVHAATLNPTDLLFRAGAQSRWMTHLSPPHVAGMEFSGFVHAIGPGTADLRVGTPVIGIVNPLREGGGGAHAQFVKVPAASVTSRIDGIPMVHAATLPMNGLTAVTSLETLNLSGGSTLLVTGGPGAVGSYTIQLAKLAGLEVVADARPDDVEWLTGLGVDHVVPRGPAMAQDVRSLFPHGVHGAVDAARLGDSADRAVRDGGKVIAVRRDDLGHGSTESRVKRFAISVHTQIRNTVGLDRLADLAAQGSLRTRVAHEIPFTEAALAHRILAAGGVRGRVVLRLN